MTIYTNTLKRIFRNPLALAFICLFPILLGVLMSFTGFGGIETGDVGEMNLKFGLADSDNTVLSKTLANQLGLRYNIVEVEKDDIAATLTDDQEIPWILHIPEGYGESVIKGEAPQLEGYSLTVSDVSALGSVKAESITKSLMLLGTDDETVLQKWEDSVKNNDEIVNLGKNWESAAFALGFFGFTAIFTAYFVVKILIDDKYGGMPDRIGVLPVSSRKYLVYGALAAFTATEISTFLSVVIARVQWGELPNPLALFAIMSLYNLFSICVIMAIVSLSKGMGAASVAMTMLATLSAMLGGLFWPLEFVPAFMRKIAWFSPGYWLSEGMKNIEEITFEGFFLPVLFLLGFTLAAIALGGWKSVRRMED